MCLHAAQAACHSYANRCTHKKFQHTFKIPPSALFLHQTSLVTFSSQFPRAPAVAVKTPSPRFTKKKEEIAVIVRRPAPGRCAHRVHGCARGSHGATTCTKDTPNPPLDHGRAGSPCLQPHPHSPIPTIPTPQELQGAPKGHRRSRAAQWHLCMWPSGETTLPGQTNFFFFIFFWLSFAVSYKLSAPRCRMTSLLRPPLRGCKK